MFKKILILIVLCFIFVGCLEVNNNEEMDKTLINKVDSSEKNNYQIDFNSLPASSFTWERMDIKNHTFPFEYERPSESEEIYRSEFSLIRKKIANDGFVQVSGMFFELELGIQYDELLDFDNIWRFVGVIDKQVTLSKDKKLVWYNEEFTEYFEVVSVRNINNRIYFLQKYNDDYRIIELDGTVKLEFPTVDAPLDFYIKDGKYYVLYLDKIQQFENEEVLNEIAILNSDIPEFSLQTFEYNTDNEFLITLFIEKEWKVMRLKAE